MEKCLKNNCFLCLFASSVFILLISDFYLFGQVKSEKTVDKLKLIQIQIEDKKKELEKYISRQEDLKLQLKALRVDEKKTNTIRQLISNNLEKVQKEIFDIKKKYEALKVLYNSVLKELTNEAAFLYFKKFSFSDYYGTNTIIEEIISRNIIIGKSILAKTLDKNTEKAGNDIKRLTMRRQEIIREKEMVEIKLKKSKKALDATNIEIRENKKRYMELEKEIEELKRSAIELTALVKKLEKQSPYKKSAGIFLTIPKNSLPWPLEGKVISRFGKEYVGELKTWIVREGIRIKAQSNPEVHPVCSGQVIFSGPFRNYGKVVIIDHKENFYSVYGFLKEIYVPNGSIVNENSIIGMAGDEQQSFKEKEKSVLYFEIRVGEEAVDPLLWLK